MESEQQGELQEELAQAHQDYQKGMNTHAFFRLPDRTISEDLVQDAFTKTWKYLLKGGKIDIMKAFLYHVLNNLIVDEYRKKKNISLDLLLEKGFEPGTNPADRLMNVLDGKKAMLLIQRLPVKYQRVMRMRYVQDLSLKEMALVTGETKNALAVQAYRGLQKLRLMYKTM